jgi:hypothetical protein
MMKNKHNKKRNTAFVFESLVREVTVSIMKGDLKRKNKVINIIRSHFGPNTEMRQHLECYKSLYENQGVVTTLGEKILYEAKMASRLIDPACLFKQQTALIDDINKDLTPSVFNNFVPNYKTLATIDQILSRKIAPKQRVMLEQEVVKNMAGPGVTLSATESIDTLTLNFFTNKFNEKYSNVLTEDQKTLLSCYITSFADNSVELKTFLNEEVSRLKDLLGRVAVDSIFVEDQDMQDKATALIEKLNTLNDTTINEKVLLTVLKTQELAKELTDGCNN